MSTAYQQYLEFSQGGIRRGLRGLYLIRGWRPVLLPTLAVPFLGLFRGHVVAAAAVPLLAAYLGWTWYVYAIARRYLMPFQAVSATLATVTFPAFVQYALVFNTEIFWLFTSFASLYHVFMADRFRRRMHACLAGVFLGLSVMIRPAETTIIMALPFGYLLADAWRIGAVDRKEFALGLTVLGTIGAMLVASTFVTELSRIVLLGGGGIVLAVWLVVRRGRLHGVSLFCGTLSALSLGWWAGFMPALYSWVYTTSFGEMAQKTNDHRMEGVAETLWRAFQIYLGEQFGIFVCVAVIGLAATAFERRSRTMDLWKTDEAVRYPPSELGLLAMAMVMPIATLYALSGTSDPRRPIVGMAVTMLCVAILSVRGHSYSRIRTFVVLCVVAVNAFGLLNAAQIGITLPARMVSDFRLYLPPARLKADENPYLIDALTNLGVTRNDGVAVYTLALFQSSARIYEPAALELAALIKGQPARIVYLWDDGDYTRVLAVLYRQDNHYLLLDLYDGPGARDTHYPYVEFTTALLDRLAGGADPPPGLERVGTIHLGGRDHVLFRILPPN